MPPSLGRTRALNSDTSLLIVRGPTRTPSGKCVGLQPQQTSHEPVDKRRDAFTFQRGTDQLSGTDEVDSRGQIKARRRVFSAPSGGHKFSVNLLASHELRDRQFEHDLVEVTRTPLPSALEMGGCSSCGLAI